MFFRSMELNYFMKSLILLGMASPYITDMLIEKLLNLDKDRPSNMNLRTLGPLVGQRITVKSKNAGFKGQ